MIYNVAVITPLHPSNVQKPGRWLMRLIHAAVVLEGVGLCINSLIYINASKKLTEMLEQEDPEQKESRLPLTRLFNTASAKVLDFLLINEGLDYTKNEMAELIAIPERTVQRSLQSLLSEQIIKRDKKNGRVFYYAANLSNPRVGGLLGYANSTLLANIDDAAKNASGRQKGR